MVVHGNIRILQVGMYSPASKKDVLVPLLPSKDILSLSLLSRCHIENMSSNLTTADFVREDGNREKCLPIPKAVEKMRNFVQSVDNNFNVKLGVLGQTVSNGLHFCAKK